MKRETYILLFACALGFAGALAWRFGSPAAQPADRPVETAAVQRIADYDATIAALSEFDPALILYHETGTLMPDGLGTLTAIAVDVEDRIYAGGGDAVVVLDPQGSVVRRIKLDGNVSSLAVDPSMRLYVGLGDAVQVFDPEGVPVAVFREIPARAMVTALVATEDAVFVADANSRTVMRFALDGTLQQVNDGKGGQSDSAGFVIPSPSFDITTGQAGTLWVVNPGRQRLEEYNHNAERIRVWDERPGMEVEAFCGCCNPAHIARLSDGTIVTSEKGLLRIKLYAPRGQFLGVVAAPSQFDDADITLDLAVDSRDRILVADPARRQVRIFERKVKRDEGSVSPFSRNRSRGIQADSVTF